MGYGTKFDTRTIRGKKVELYVSTTGMFNANLDGNNLESKTITDLVEEIDKALKCKVSIPFHRWDDGRLVNGVVTGVHGRTKNYLLRIDGKSSQEYYYSSNAGKFLRLSPGEESEYTALKQAEAAAEEASLKFEREHRIDVPKEIEKAMNE
jgi:hypothetical protein